MPVDIIIFAIVAIFLAFRLRDALGTQHDQSRSRPNPYTQSSKQKEKKPASTANENVVPLNDKIAITVPQLPLAQEANEKFILQIIGKIARYDNNFKAHDFVEKAKNAFPIIVEAYSKGDKETLKNLVTPRLYNDFEQSIIQREEKGHTAITEVQAVRGANIIDIYMEKTTAYITLRFTAEEIAFVRDSEGQLIAGNPNTVDTVKDVWTFGRDLKSNDPRWMLFKTEPDTNSAVQEQ